MENSVPEETSANVSSYVTRSRATETRVMQSRGETGEEISVKQSGTMNKLVPGEKSDNASDLPRLAYTMEETAKILGVSYITVHRLLKRGLLRSSFALRHKMIPVTEIQRFLNSTLE